MDNVRNLFLLPWFTAAIIAFLTTPLVIKLATRLGIIDDPKKNKHPKVIHTYPTPRGGGIPIFLALLIGSLIFLPIDKHAVGILIGAAILVVMGTLDDRFNLNPYLRLGLGFLAAAAPIAAGIGISFISNPLGGIIDLSQPQINFTLFGSTHSIWVLSDLFAILWITFLMNIVNMGAKGVDGQLSGVTVIAALTIAFLSLFSRYCPMARNHFGRDYCGIISWLFTVAYFPSKNYARIRRKYYGGIPFGGFIHSFHNQSGCFDGSSRHSSY
jgi:UDP-GlcNAc:undecaprenyl-phosphate GlcNAc-1-phosphate transferase